MKQRTVVYINCIALLGLNIYCFLLGLGKGMAGVYLYSVNTKSNYCPTGLLEKCPLAWS